MENRERILEGHSDLEKGAYLGAIASIATADRSASPLEIQYLADLCDTADLSERQKKAVVLAASEESGNDLAQCLEVLKNSDLKYSLVTDLMAFAKSDGDYTDEEKENIEKISRYLGINEHQTSLLDEFAEKANTVDPSSDDVSRPGFLSALGLKDKMQSAGINAKNFLKGLLGLAGPMILSRMITRGLRRGRSATSFAGFSNMFNSGSGVGSLIRMLSGGRSMNKSGSLIGRILPGGH